MDKVVLQPLTMRDAEIFYQLYSNPLVAACFVESPFLPGETPSVFTERIVNACNFIFTIRPADKPGLIIGDCALHHWNDILKEASIGGSLLPDYWGMGYMQDAFCHLAVIAKQELGALTLVGQTRPRNTKAIRLVEKMGFSIHHSNEQEIVLRKEL